jgi:hypothetical protein
LSERNQARHRNPSSKDQAQINQAQANRLGERAPGPTPGKNDIDYDSVRLQLNLLRDFFSLRMLRLLVIATLLLPRALLSQQPHQLVSPVTFPPVTADALDKAKLSLPADFAKPLNLLVLSFARDQQDAVETWVQTAQQIGSAHPQVQLWVLPVSSREDNLFKWWLNSSMRGSLLNSESPHYTVPLYVNKPQFRKALAIPSEKQIVVLLTSKAGLVLWRSEGSATDERKASLASFLTTLPPAR